MNFYHLNDLMASNNLLCVGVTLDDNWQSSKHNPNPIIIHQTQWLPNGRFNLAD